MKNNQIMTLKEAADWAGVSVKNLRALIAAGKMEVIKVTPIRNPRVTLNELEKFFGLKEERV